ncbi:hypothetical protein AB1N83_009769 [Pleurotus pulmonarius]
MVENMVLGIVGGSPSSYHVFCVSITGWRGHDAFLSASAHTMLIWTTPSSRYQGKVMQCDLEHYLGRYAHQGFAERSEYSAHLPSSILFPSTS